MEVFDIRNYIWDIFKISKNQQYLNLREALNMFLVNIELGFDRYEGSNIDYLKLKPKWNMLSERGKKRQLYIFDYIIKNFSVFILRSCLKSDKETINRFKYMDIPGLEEDNYRLYNMTKTEYEKKNKTSRR